MPLLNFLLGRPLRSSEEESEKIGVLKGIPVFGLDALGSAAYGPEAALTLLIPLGLAGLHYILPLSLVIIALLAVVYLSYHQTIAAYPSGGGSYTVAHQNLGTFPGLLAAAALLTDYTLDAAVGISAGINALISAFPHLQSSRLSLCLGALTLLTIFNLRGVRENGAIFILPSYLFLASMFAVIGIGIVRTMAAGGHPHPVVPPPAVHQTLATVGVWLILRAFAGGCTALTGVEAVSNGVQAFRDDRVKRARLTLATIIGALAIMLAGIAYLVKAYGIVATDPDSKAYQSILSMLIGAVTGRGWFYYVAMSGILLVLIFSANTAFADFPRVCRFIAEDGYLPTSFANRGRRLVYTEGILVLATITALLLIGFRGITDRLIPLFAVGAFLAFTMSQAGMVAHWKREGGASAKRSMFLNGLGALATGVTVIIVILAKFREGAWITLIAIPALLTLMYRIRRHYDVLEHEITTEKPLDLANNSDPLIVVPLAYWNRVTREALRVGMNLSREVKVIHVAEDNKQDEIREHWRTCVAEPLEAARHPVPELVEIKSPYRFVVAPIVKYARKLSSENPDRRIVIIIPELMENRWYYYFLHTQRAALLKTELLRQGNDRISVLNIPWYLKST